VPGPFLLFFGKVAKAAFFIGLKDYGVTMAMNRAKKAEELKEIQDLFASNEVVVVTENKGLSVAKSLRRLLRAEGAQFKVTKNSLAKVALKGTQFEVITDLFKGPVGVAVSKDPVAAAKVTQKFAKDNDKLVILGGAFGGKALSAGDVKQLATLPSLDELRGRLVGLIVAPAQKIAASAQAPAPQLARVLKAYSEK